MVEIKGTLKKFKWEEVHKHNKYEDCWLVIKGKVYNVTSWIPKHPGGIQILNGAGRESTALFQSYHCLRIEKFLKAYEIGEVEDYYPYYTWDSNFYVTIKKRVEAHFKERGITGSDSPLLYFKTLMIILGWFFFYYLTFFRGNVFAAIFLGIFHSQFGISIAHDGNHGGFSYKYPWLTRIAAYTMDIMGGSSLVWLHQHNIGHHPYVNREGGYYNEDYDPDSTSAFPVLRSHPNQSWKPYIAFQHIYIWFLIPFSGIKWAIGDVKWMIKGRYNDINFYEIPSSEVIKMVIFKTVFICYAFILPLFLQPLWKAALMITLFVCVNGTLFILNFAVNHLLEENVFPDHLTEERDWAKLQVVASSNYATNSTFWTWFSGGLNHQIEHHLFPSICHMYLSEIAPIVQQTCKEYRVSYTNKASYFDALVSYYRFMKKLGQDPCEKIKVL